MLTLSVIVPAYNEEATIAEILGQVNAQKIDGVELEVIVVDDGSKDRTVEILEAEPTLYTKLIKQPRNGGKGAAVKAGLEAASGDYVLFQDADLEYSPDEYGKLLRPVIRFGADLCMINLYAPT
ncbi:MAG: glycosyltransferase family 2 protein, partial [Rhodospirillaceae bacterium]